MYQDIENTLRLLILTFKYPKESVDMSILRLSYLRRCFASGTPFFSLYFVLGFLLTDGFCLILWLGIIPFFPDALFLAGSLNIFGYAMTGVGQGLDLECPCLTEHEKNLLICGEDVLRCLEAQITLLEESKKKGKLK